MVALKTQVSEKNPLVNEGTVGGPQTNPANEEKLLDDLKTVWQKLQGRDLEARHKTGQLLNRHCGSDPSKRLKRGDEVMAKAAKQLGLSVADLSRMRSLARHFEDIDVFRKKHPDIKTWTEVKKLLPTLRGETDKSPRKKVELSTAEKLVRSIKQLTSKVGEVEEQLPEPVKIKLRDCLGDFTRAMSERLGISASEEELDWSEVPLSN